MKRLGAALLALACSGCWTTEFPFLLWIDANFSLEEQCLAVDAVERWEAASSLIRVDVRIGRPPTDADHVLEFATSYDDGSDDTAAWTENEGGRMHVLAERIRARRVEDFPQVFVGVVAHEFGHHIGLQHDGNPNTLMYYRTGQWCVTQRDLDQFCRHFGCSQIAPPCEPPPDYCMIGE